MFSAVTYHHPDGTPYTPEEEQAAENRRRRREQENRTYYTLEKNVERIADALEILAQSDLVELLKDHADTTTNIATAISSIRKELHDSLKGE